MREVMVEKQLKHNPSKIKFSEDDSMLKQWENMHRPPSPDHIITPSGPGQVGNVDPTNKELDRRCSVISMNQTKSITMFPLLSKKGGDMRRPSDIFQSMYVG